MQAIQRGLQTRQSSGPGEPQTDLHSQFRQESLTKRATHAVYWIQISGASALASFELANSDFVPGSPSSTVYDDISGIDDLNSLVRAFPSRAIDNFVLDLAANDPSIKTALIWPCVVYGTGEGFGKTWSTQIPTLCSLALEKGHAVRVGEGLNRWGTVHVRDLGMLVRLLAEAASARREDKDLWGSNGIYLTGVGETVRSKPFSPVVEYIQLMKARHLETWFNGSVVRHENKASLTVTRSKLYQRPRLIE